MNKEELRGMLKLSMVSMIINRVHLKKYGGIFREINIIDNECMRVDFLDKADKIRNEGEYSIYYDFESFDKMISEIEAYTGKAIDEWVRYFTDPEIFYNESEDWNEEPDWELFFYDFNNNLISLPSGYLRRRG